MLAGLDEPASGHIERFASHVYVAQQQDISPQTTLAELLGYEAILQRVSASIAAITSLTIWRCSTATGI